MKEISTPCPGPIINCPTSPSSAGRIRTRFLHKIGIDAQPECSSTTTNKNDSKNSPSNQDFPGRTSSGESCLGDVHASTEPLKTGLESDDSSMSSSLDSDDGDFFIGSFNSIDSDDGKMSFFQKPLETPTVESCTKDSNNKPWNLNASLHSVPSLTASCDESAATLATTKSENLSGSRTRKWIGSSVARSTSSPSISNKRPRLGLNFNRRRRKRSVSLHKSVSIIPIPSRDEYSCTVKERLWSSSAELCANAARNSIEFASEGWNWRDVVEDEEMFVHKPSGELIHPVHLRNAFASMAQNDLASNNNPDTSI